MLASTRRTLGTAAFVALIFPAAMATAQSPDMVRVRGTIESIDGQMVNVKGRDGTAMKVKLTDDAKVLAVDRKSLADVKQGVFVGITAMPQPDGSQKAVEIHIFPEALRGLGEGHRGRGTDALACPGDERHAPGQSELVEEWLIHRQLSIRRVTKT